MKNKFNILFCICLIPSYIYGQSDTMKNSSILIEFNEKGNLNINLYDMDKYKKLQEKEPFYRFARPIKISEDIKSFAILIEQPIDSINVYHFTINANAAMSLSAVLRSNNWKDAININISDGINSSQNNSIRIEDLEKSYWSSDIISGNILKFEIVEHIRNKNIPIYLEQVNYGFRSFNGNFNASCTNQVDITCTPERDDWIKEIRSSCLIRVNNQGFCSGAVINNTSEDGSPYVLTAQHCFAMFSNGEERINAANNSKFLFNYNSQWCGGPEVTSWDEIHGASILAQWDETDFLLLELNQQIPTEFYTYYSGWNRLNTQPASGVGIHHPSGDVKKIATHSQTPVDANCMTATPIPYSNPIRNFAFNNNFFRISPWDVTTNGHSQPEGGSSGSPLYNANKRIIGQLFGADCNFYLCTNSQGNQNRTSDQVAYGRLSMSWTGGGTFDSRLSNWLDPIGLIPDDFFGLRYIRYYTVNHDAWYTGDIVKFHDVNILSGYNVVVTELQDKFEVTGEFTVPVGSTFQVNSP